MTDKLDLRFKGFSISFSVWQFYVRIGSWPGHFEFVGQWTANVGLKVFEDGEPKLSSQIVISILLEKPVIVCKSVVAPE